MQGFVPSLGTLVGPEDPPGRSSLQHLPPPCHCDSLSSWVPDQAFCPRQSRCAQYLPNEMVWRFPLHHPATALAGALGCKGSAKGRCLWE